MTNIIPFKRPKASEKHKGKTLCKTGFHQWIILNEKKFDVKEGKLITVFQCSRCGKIKNSAL
ncbi:hypothetical protein [Marinagarivorans algicola]|uniref:hypothetical protein n=1 Tax=Marinagarivorans algicola TaxID=1513270 RepID=UPI0006B8EB77|nr:hypothetical protein [Marinagarivorans algicola]